MNRILTVRIENFQSHQDTLLELSPGLNVIVGPSDQGKSAILRAVKWVLYNEPRGMEFIRQGESYARVTLEISNGYRIIRERSKSRNRYIVVDPSGDEQVFEGFGNEVPLEVYRAHGIYKVRVDHDIETSLNIGNQLEGPFLISETGSVRAKAIGRLTGLHIVDKAIRDCLTDLRKNNQQQELVLKDLDATREKLKEFSFLEEKEKQIRQAEEMLSQLHRKAEREKELEEQAQAYGDLLIEKEELTELLKTLKGTAVCEQMLLQCAQKLSGYHELTRQDMRLKDLVAGIDEAIKQLKATRDIREVHDLLQTVEQLVQRDASMGSFQLVYCKLEKEIMEEQRLYQHSTALLHTQPLILQIEEKAQHLGALEKLAEKLESQGYELEGHLKLLNQMEPVKFAESLFEPLAEAVSRLQKLETCLLQLDSSNNSIREGSAYLRKNALEMEEYLKAYTKELRRQGKCPLCHSTIDNRRLQDIIDHYEEVHQ